MPKFEKFIRKLRRVSSHSYTLNVPKDIIEDLSWRERQKLEIRYDKKKKEFKVRDWKK